MIFPTKHENLDKNILVLGAEVIKLLKDGSINIELAYQYMKRVKEISIDNYYDTILFLWLLDYVKLEEDLLTLNKVQNDTAQV